MVQNPHHYPWRHAPSLASCSHPGVTLSHWCRAARRAPINARKASPVMRGASRATNSTTGLVSDEAKHLNGKSQPQLIGLNLP